MFRAPKIGKFPPRFNLSLIKNKIEFWSFDIPHTCRGSNEKIQETHQTNRVRYFWAIRYAEFVNIQWGNSRITLRDYNRTGAPAEWLRDYIFLRWCAVAARGGVRRLGNFLRVSLFFFSRSYLQDFFFNPLQNKIFLNLHNPLMVLQCSITAKL